MGTREYLLEKAKNEGLEKGKKQEAIAITKEMKKDGLPNSQIAKFTKFSIEGTEKP